jgi:ferric-dicitrate binding protein FerR (iron transport regulator)
MGSISELISQYLDDDLDDRAFDHLSELLRDNVSATDDLVLSSYIHSQLIDLMGRRRVQGSVAGESLIDEEDGYRAARSAPALAGRAAAGLPLHTTSKYPKAKSAARRWWSRHPIGLAAAVMVAVSMLALGFWSLSRPFVAQLSRSVGCRWEGPDGDLPIGTLLRAGQELNLSEGRAEVTFASGAKVILEGPSRLRLDSAGAAELSSGRIATNVPTQSIGFTITTPLARFVDLGTEFGLRMNPTKGFELHVFDGLVELQFIGREGEVVPKPLRISEVFAIRYNAETGEIASQLCDQSERMSL